MTPTWREGQEQAVVAYCRYLWRLALEGRQPCAAAGSPATGGGVEGRGSVIVHPEYIKGSWRLELDAVRCPWN